ncbi:MAG: N-acetylmuramoyl-L-alanine amidase [Deltaproteobacteria bacterium]|nr:N-acetylmuramoyl-L-alanine amidase [Deltaproteobacteria bacterium]
MISTGRPAAFFRLKMAFLASMILWALFAFPACATAQGIPAKDIYLEAERCRDRLFSGEKDRGQRDNWISCIVLFKDVAKTEPEGPWAAAGLFSAAEMYLELNHTLGDPEDLASALDLYEIVVSDFPKSSYAIRSRKALAAVTVKRSVKKRTFRETAAQKADQPPPPPPGPAVPSAPKGSAARVPPGAVCMEPAPVTAPSQAGPVTVTGIRFWSNSSYTRLVIDATNDAAFTQNQLPADPAANKPPRLYFDILKAKLSPSVSSVVPVNDDLLISVRAGQNSADTVRVVVDCKSVASCKTFALSNPFRLVIDVIGEKETAVAVKPPAPDKPPKGKPKPKKPKKAPKPKKPSADDLARQLALGVRTIVIDAGHGGKDPGAVGTVKGVQEKELVLDMARTLAKKLKAKTGCNVILTRTGDRFLSLEERPAQANTKRGDLFISIHANATCNVEANGIETYFLNLATDEDAIALAARENATSQKSISDLQGILKDLLRNAKVEESTRLARRVQESMVRAVSEKHPRVVDKGVKQAPFYVLLGAQMPAILVETGFITNEEECRRLMDEKYRNMLCEGIAEGVAAYIEDLKPSISRRR